MNWVNVLISLSNSDLTWPPLIFKIFSSMTKHFKKIKWKDKKRKSTHFFLLASVEIWYSFFLLKCHRRWRLLVLRLQTHSFNLFSSLWMQSWKVLTPWWLMETRNYKSDNNYLRLRPLCKWFISLKRICDIRIYIFHFLSKGPFKIEAIRVPWFCLLTLHFLRKTSALLQDNNSSKTSEISSMLPSRYEV